MKILEMLVDSKFPKCWDDLLEMIDKGFTLVMLKEGTKEYIDVVE